MNSLKAFFSRFMGTVFAGVFLMLPLAVVVIIVLKIYQMAIVPVRDVANKMGIERPLLIELLLLFILLVFCFFAGLLMHTGTVSRFRDSLESNVLRFVPGYEFIRMRLALMVGQDRSSFNRAVLVRIDDGWSPALMVEEGQDGTCTVFVPDVPKSNSGAVYLVDKEQVRPLEINFNKLDMVIRNYGKGLAQLVSESEVQKAR